MTRLGRHRRGGGGCRGGRWRAGEVRVSGGIGSGVREVGERTSSSSSSRERRLKRRWRYTWFESGY